MKLTISTLALAAAVVLCLPQSAGAEDHHHAEFRCGKTFVTFQAMQMRENGTGAEIRMLHTVRKAHIMQVTRVPPEGPPFVSVSQPVPEVAQRTWGTGMSVLVLNRGKDWSRLVECLD